MRNHSFIIISLVLVSLISFVACEKTPKYPELSAVLTDSLRQTNIPGVFIAGTKNIQPRPVQDPSNLCPATCASVRVYLWQVTYPITICQPPDFPSTLANKDAGQDSVIVDIASSTPVTKMVSKKSIGGFERLFCKTHGGPWIATIQETEMCDNSCGPGTRKFVMTIGGVPDDLSWLWWDSMDNRPEEVDFVGEPWIKSESVIDCDSHDLTDCGHPI